MALTVAPVINHVPGNLREVYVDVTFDNSYPTGGYAFAPSQFQMGQFYFVDIANINGYAFHYNYTTNKVQAYSASGTELANASGALNGIKIRFACIGA